MKVFVLNGWAAGERAWDLCAFPRERVFSYTEQLDGVAADVLAGEDGFVLVGWSMGGSAALSFAVSMPEKIKGLVLLAATARMMKAPDWEGMTPRRLQALEVGLRMTRGEGFSALPEGAPNPYLMDGDENLSRGLDYLRTVDLRAGLTALAGSGRLACPVYIFQSERDGIVRRSNARFLQSVFPHAKTEIVPGSEHALPVIIPRKIDAAVDEILTYPSR